MERTRRWQHLHHPASRAGRRSAGRGVIVRWSTGGCGKRGAVGMTRILVVEDEESFADALTYMLHKEGFEVEVATSGVGALDEFDRTGADLVLLDLMLPGLSGVE